ncbi:MAG TPA: hypothetical protein VF629_25095 [Hymenobacter sp.]|jgi:photosystem II stability/assembly factor-like uncharacterized protein|uniref:hypothetical protein n=1 Tax=Hymenobacter sp. TaxID=1898978 RepID=UPI002EDAB860
MKRFLPLLFIGLLAAACQKDDPKLAPREAEDPDWIKLEIPTKFSGDEAYSIIGDIDKTLVVSTKAQVYVSSDRGKTWQETQNSAGAMFGFVMRNDTIFSLNFSGTDSQGRKTAINAEFYSTNFGQTWARFTLLPNGYYKARAFSQPIGQLTAGSVAYRTQENFQAMPNSSSKLVLASDLLRSAGGTETPVRLPSRHYLNGLHLDAQRRLYVGASGLRFDDKGKAIDPTVSWPAVVYVSRQPLP